MDGSLISDSAAEKILAEARKRFKISVEAERENRTAAMDDMEFIVGNQWPEAAKKSRGDRPCLTINRMPAFVRQVVNEQRKIRPAIDVIPADSKAAKATADVIQGLVRHIERMSRSQIAYDNAFEYAVTCGIGHFRVRTKYCSDESMEQELSIDRIENPFTVYRDPFSREADHSDDRWTFVTEMVDPETFEDKYGIKPSKFADFASGDDAPEWFDGEDVRVAEYWRCSKDEVEIHVLQSGTRIEGPITKAQREKMATLDPVVGSRKVERTRVEQYILTYDKVLKVGEWAGKFIPILTVKGGEINVNGKRVLTSLVRDAKEPARIYNYWTSAETEIVALQPKAPWIAPEGSFEGHENEWARANTENFAYLEFVPVPNGGPPQRQFFPGVPQGIREGRMAAAEDMKAVTGLYDASLGARSNETSGVAIRERQKEGDTATYHYIDNMSRAIEQCGRVLIDLIPKVYDTPRTIRIVGPDNQEQIVAINQLFIDPATGQETQHDMQVGRYDVAVKVGPSFESKRQEMTEAMMELAARNPQVMQIAGDLIMRNMDWPESEKIAERLEKMLPPQLRGEQPPPSPEQQLAQAQVKVEEIKAQAAMAKAQGDGQMKGADLQLKQQEMQVAQQELALKAQELQVRQAESAMGLQQEAERTQLEREKIALEREKVAVELLQSGGMITPEQTAQKDQMQAAIITSVQALSQQFGAVAQALMAPKETQLITGPDGRPSSSVTRPMIN